MSETRSEFRGLGTGSTELPIITLRATICNHAWPTWSTIFASDDLMRVPVQRKVLPPETPYA